MTEMLHCHWLNKNKYKLDKLNLTRLWVLVTIYQKNTWLFVLVTIYPKIKIEIKPRSTYPKKLNSEARLQNWKVLGTHFAQIEYGLLNSNDQCTLYAWYEWYITHMKHLIKLSHISLFYECLSHICLFYECVLFFVKNSYLLLWKKMIWLIKKKKKSDLFWNTKISFGEEKIRFVLLKKGLLLKKY